MIPKEIRQALRISDGDPLEIFVEGDAVIFKKYSTLSMDSDVKRAIRNSLPAQRFPRYALYDTYAMLEGWGGVVFPICVPESFKAAAEQNNKSSYFVTKEGNVELWVAPIRTSEGIFGYLVGETNALGDTYDVRALNISYVEGVVSMVASMIAED